MTAQGHPIEPRVSPCFLSPTPATTKQAGRHPGDLIRLPARTMRVVQVDRYADGLLSVRWTAEEAA